MTIPKITPYSGGVANPDGSQTQTEFTQNMFDQLSYEANLATELNNTVDGINDTAIQVDADATSAAQSASAAEAAVSGLNYKGLWPDTGGIADKGDTYQTQVSGTGTGQYFTALQNTTVDPVGDDVNWRGVVSNQSLGELTNYQAASVADMVQGKTLGGKIVMLEVGQVWSINGKWRYNGGTSGTVADFDAIGDIYPRDFGESQEDIESAYSIGDTVIDAPYLVNDFTFTKVTKFIGLGKITATGSLTINASIVAPLREVINSSGVTAWSVGESVDEIKPEWFSDGVGPTEGAMTIRGVRAGRSLVGTGNGYCEIDGYRAAELTTSAIEGIALGPFTAASATSIDLCTLAGYSALRGKEVIPGSGIFEPTFALNSSVFGAGALQDGTSHINSTVAGCTAGRNVPTSSGLNLFGYRSAINSGPINNGVIMGTSAALVLNQGNPDTVTTNVCIIGSGAAQQMQQGKRITSFGDTSSRYNDSGDDLTNIGYLAGAPFGAGSVSRQINLGSSCRSSADDTITIGNNLINSTPGRMYLGDAQTSSSSIQGVHNNTTASAANVYIDEFGVLQRSTSTGKYKEILEPLSLEWACKVLDFEPVVYKPTKNAVNEDWSYYGYIAEQVALIDPRYCHMTRDVIGERIVEGSVIPDENGVTQKDSNGNEIREPDRKEFIYSDEPTPSGVMYERVVTAQGLIIKDLLERVKSLEEKL